jgi:hypothetical protein
MLVYGEQINLLSAAEIDEVTEYGGSVHFVHDIRREILGLFMAL